MSPSPTFSPSRVHIVLAEDDVQMSSIVADALRKDGYVVDMPAPNGLGLVSSGWRP